MAVTALIVGTQSIGGPAGSAPTAKAASAKISTNGGRAAVKTWSAAEMRAAKPMRMPSPKAGSGSAISGATGPAGSIAGAGPAGSSLSTASGASVDGGVSPLAGSFTYPTPFDRYQVPVLNSYPHATVGKVFFNQNGGSFVCSASVIAENSIWLAGHCVSDGARHFSTNLTFVPQYNNGFRPFGTFSCPTLFVLTSWHTTHNFRADEAVANCGTSGGRTLRAAVGRLGFAWNQTQPKHYNSLGYPQASPFNGATMQQCQSSFGHFDTRIGGSGPTPFAIGCDMTGGSSGGPWILKYVPGVVGAVNMLNGHNDYKYTNPNEPLEMYSPYLDNSSRTLLCTATELC
jgi:V8-like Glu-specific endopeptidase